MHIVSLGIAAALAAALATPAQAESRNDGSLPTVHRGSDGNHGDWRRDHRRDRDRRRDGDFRHDRDDRRDRDDDSVFYYDRIWDGGTAWRADSFNDWWHDNPHRSSPRWVSDNRGCRQMWWGNGGWRC